MFLSYSSGLWYLLSCTLYALVFLFFFFNDTATTEIYTLSLHDALPISLRLTALVALVWMLLQPVLSRKVNRELEREVVIVMDDSASMHLIDEGQTSSRFELVESALEASGLFEELKGKVGVRIIRAARRALGEDEEEAEGWDQATDLANALTTVLEQVPPDNLAGIVMATDGRHNRPGRVEDIARRFGILDAPVGIVAVGSEKPPRDIAILEVRSPDAIYLGDRLRVTTVLKFDGYRGRTAKVRLKRGDEVVDEKTITIPQDHHREEDRKSTRLNSSHIVISYAVFCLKKNKK